MRGVLILTGAIVLLGLLLGGLVLTAGDSLEDELIEELEDSPEPDYVHASISTTAETEWMTMSDTLWATADGMSKHEFRGTTNMTIIDDGNTQWQHSITEEWVTKSDSPGQNVLKERYETTRTLFDELQVASVDPVEHNGAAAYRVQFDPPEEIDQTLLDILRTPISPDTQSEEQAETPREYTDVNRVEIWLEKEHLFPVKTVTEDDDGVVKTTYDDVSFDPIPEGRFTFESPNEHLDVRERTSYTSIDEATENISTDVPELTSVPSEYEFVAVNEVTSLETSDTSVSVDYEDSEGHQITISQTNYPREQISEAGGEQVELNGVTGYYSEEVGVPIHAVSWECDGLEYFLIGDETIETDALISMASSVDCS